MFILKSHGVGRGDVEEGLPFKSRSLRDFDLLRDEDGHGGVRNDLEDVG
jgi:hypothetical protein